MGNNKAQVIKHAMIIETFKEIYALCWVEYIATEVLLIDSLIWMSNWGRFLWDSGQNKKKKLVIGVGKKNILFGCPKTGPTC